jgi:hypothetical protein
MKAGGVRHGTGRILAPDRLSDLIGAIYDCAIDPGLWPETINAICDVTDCCGGLIAVTDLDPPQARLMKSWNYDSAWLARIPEYADEVARVWAKVPGLNSRPLDEPGSPRRELPATVFRLGPRSCSRCRWPALH